MVFMQMLALLLRLLLLLMATRPMLPLLRHLVWQCRLQSQGQYQQRRETQEQGIGVKSKSRRRRLPASFPDRQLGMVSEVQQLVLVHQLQRAAVGCR